MLTLTRIVTALYTAAATIAAIYLGWEKVAIAVGFITPAASALANVTKDGTVIDAILSGLAVNVSQKTTAGAR